MNTASVEPVNVVGGAMIAQVSMLTIMLAGWLMIRRSDVEARSSGRPTLASHAGLILALALVSLALLGASDAFSGVWAPLLREPMGSLTTWSSALLLVFILDIVVVTILVFSTGRGRDSPFQAIYFLIPTLAIFLHETAGRVVLYLFLVGFSFSLSMLCSNIRLGYEDETRWRRAYWFVSLASFVLATMIGLLARQP